MMQTRQCPLFSPTLLGVLVLALILSRTVALASETPSGALAMDVLGEPFSIAHYPAEGDRLILWIAPNHGTDEREKPVAGSLADIGIEVWHVDLAENLFLPKSTSTMRGLDGRYVAALIAVAHARTGKTVTLLSRAYGALQALRGARLWQLGQAPGDGEDPYVAGAILFSPELYSEVPALGMPPVFDPIARATSLPLMLFQAGSRNNRWQLDELLGLLRQGGAQVYTEILPGVTGVFYEGDTAPATLEAWRAIAPKISRVSALLERTRTPLSVPELESVEPRPDAGLDTRLEAFEGNPVPDLLVLPNLQDESMEKVDFLGKVTVVNFWATWCPPCVEEIPSLNRLRRRMQGKDFQLVSVDYAEEKQRVVEFLGRVDVDFPVLLDADGSVAAKWRVLVFPSTFVVGPQGKIIYGVNGAIQWDSDEVVAKLDALLEDQGAQ